MSLNRRISADRIRKTPWAKTFLENPLSTLLQEPGMRGGRLLTMSLEDRLRLGQGRDKEFISI